MPDVKNPNILFWIQRDDSRPLSIFYNSLRLYFVSIFRMILSLKINMTKRGKV